MFTRKYCHISYEKFQSTCSSCGAVLNGSGIEGNFEDQNLPTLERIQLLSKSYGERYPALFTSEVSSEKIGRAEISFEDFPTGKEIFLFCDTTPMGSGIWGFLIAEDGFYWKNEETTPTNRNYLSWDEYTKEDFQPQRRAIEFGHENVFSLAGIKRYEDREKVFQLFKELKKLIGK